MMIFWTIFSIIFASGNNVSRETMNGEIYMELDTITHRRLGNCHIVGDFNTSAGSDNLFAPKVLMVACIMSQIVLKHARRYRTPDMLRP